MKSSNKNLGIIEDLVKTNKLDSNDKLLAAHYLLLNIHEPIGRQNADEFIRLIKEKE